jgi:hypothetical protein
MMLLIISLLLAICIIFPAGSPTTATLAEGVGTTELSVEQIFLGVSYIDYLKHTQAYQQAFVNTYAAVLKRPPSEIHGLVIVNASSAIPGVTGGMTRRRRELKADFEEEEGEKMATSMAILLRSESSTTSSSIPIMEVHVASRRTAGVRAYFELISNSAAPLSGATVLATLSDTGALVVTLKSQAQALQLSQLASAPIAAVVPNVVTLTAPSAESSDSNLKTTIIIVVVVVGCVTIIAAVATVIVHCCDKARGRQESDINAVDNGGSPQMASSDVGFSMAHFNLREHAPAVCK